MPKVNFCHPNGKKHWGKNIVRIDGIYFGAFAQTTHGRKLNGVILKSINQSDGVIFQSEYCLRLVEQYFGGIKTRKQIIFNGAPINNARRLLPVSSHEEFVFICVANWRPVKRLLATLDLIRHLSKNRKVKLFVVGEVSKEITDSSDGNVFFLGELSAFDIEKYMRKSHALIHLAWFDACPNTVIEALCFGIPVLCSNLGGTKELILSTNGGSFLNAMKLS